MAKKLIVDPEYLKKHPTMFTVIRVKGGKPKRVALHGECTIEVPAGAGGPGEKIRVPAPTQADLDYLFGLGHKAVIEDTSPAKGKDKKEEIED